MPRWFERTISWTLDPSPDLRPGPFAPIPDAFAPLVRGAIATWDAALQLDFAETAGPTANVAVGFGPLDGPGGSLGLANVVFSGERLLSAVVTLDRDENWATDPDTTSLFVGQPRNLFAVALHELGHAIGIEHLTTPGALMNATYGGQTDLTPPDVAAGAFLYGLESDPAAAGPRDPQSLTEGDDRFDGTPFDDIRFGLGGRDLLVGGDGSDRLDGGADDDSIWGALDGDQLFGGDGADTIGGGWGSDGLFGGDGVDGLFGQFEDDWLFGNLDGDWLYGGWGLDRLRGGWGDDRLFGGPEGDRLWGEGGADLFVLEAGGGADWVFDFAPGEDRVRIAGGAARFAELEVVAIAAGAQVRLGDASMVLVGVDPAEIGPDDLLFG